MSATHLGVGRPPQRRVRSAHGTGPPVTGSLHHKITNWLNNHEGETVKASLKASSAIAAIGIGLVASTMTPTASADVSPMEGERTTYMQEVRAGFDSRWWYDANIDDNATTVRLISCNRTGSNDSVYVTLRLWTSGWNGDESRGDRGPYRCNNSSTFNWGRQPAGDYRFEVVSAKNQNGADINFSTRIPTGCVIRW
jgi:hypothetical protein